MIKYVQNLTIPCYYTDASSRLKPTSFMDLAQEAAGQHAVHLGFGYDDLIATNTAWILSRVNVKFIDAPKWREDITLTTWHKGLNRLFFLTSLQSRLSDPRQCVAGKAARRPPDMRAVLGW